MTQTDPTRLARCSYAQFVGAFHPAELPSNVEAALATLVTASRGDILQSNQTVVLAAVGVERWPGANVLRSTATELQMVIGEPVYTPPGGQRTRGQLLESLSGSVTADIGERLRHCHGTFVGLRIGATGIEVFTDKLGVRPVHFFTSGTGLVLFSSSRTLLEQAIARLSLSLTPDDRGIAEWIAMGSPLSDRTLFKEVRRLREASVLRLSPSSGVTLGTYHRWQAQVDPALDMPTAVQMVFEAMQVSVRSRLAALPANEPRFAFLSGGMDSRLVVASLLGGAEVNPPVTVNIAPLGSMDAALGNMAGQALGTRHHHFPLRTGWLATLEQAVATCHAECDAVPSGLWWSGDGGSVGIGHVYLTAEMCSTVQRPAEDLADMVVDHNRWHLNGKALSRACRSAADLPRQGVADELTRLSHFAPERRAYGFLLFNDQQRHLDWHFDTVATLGFDLVLPFFDARLVEQVLKTPIHLMLGHRLYNQIFAGHPMGMTPWQAYPGHEPCPHPLPTELRQQWKDGWYSSAALSVSRKKAARKALRGLASAPPQLNRSNVLAAAMATLLGLRDLSYVLTEAQKIQASYGSPLVRH